MRRLLSIILILGLSACLWGMDEALERINAIKKNADYLYGEATKPTQEEAASVAFQMLQDEVMAWNGQNNSQINRIADTIMVRRANMYRVFAYVKKSSLLQESIPQHVEPQKTDSVKTEAPKDSLITDGVKKVIMQRFFGRKQNDALLRLNEAKNFFELKDIMQPLKEEGKIIDYGKYATMEHPEDCYLIVYDPAGNICAILGKGKDERENLRTGLSDSIRNYRGCGAIWFTLNE